MTNIIDLENAILTYHSDDEEQTRFITTLNNKVIVQAPAGYGKTRTMVSKLAYILVSKQILSPKKILALTFSVNAAYKIKKDVIEQLPNIVQNGEENTTINLSKKITVSNYHGFCRRVLNRYGYLLHEKLSGIHEFVAFDDGSENNINRLNLNTPLEVIRCCNNYSTNIKSSNIEYLRANFTHYNNYVLSHFIPNEYIPFNSILTLTLRLFQKHPKILTFYQKLHPIIFVDEFQDTNFLAYNLLKKLITDDSSVYLMGDALQRIYGFIGAIPNILEDAQQSYEMEMIELKKNYRFKDNPDMLLLDNNVRKNAENMLMPNISTDANIKLKIFDNQDLESAYIFEKCQKIIDATDTCKVAILFRNGIKNRNTLRIIEEFDKNDVDYFFGLFSDEDQNYKNFHFDCAKEFSKLLKNNRLSKRTCKKHIAVIKSIYENEGNLLYAALMQLVEIFYNRLYSEYSFILLDDEDKIILIKETFDGFGLKQYMEYVDSRIILSTIHGAKGLEWEYVLMPDMEQYSLPNWYGFCDNCHHKNSCMIPAAATSPKYVEEMSVFYVGFTRGKKEVFFSASKEAIKSNGDIQNRNLSCFMNLKGLCY